MWTIKAGRVVVFQCSDEGQERGAGTDMSYLLHWDKSPSLCCISGEIVMRSYESLVILSYESELTAMELGTYYIKEGWCPPWWLFSPCHLVWFFYERGIHSKHEPKHHYRMAPQRQIKPGEPTGPPKTAISDTSVNKFINMSPATALSDTASIAMSQEKRESNSPDATKLLWLLNLYIFCLVVILECSSVIINLYLLVSELLYYADKFVRILWDSHSRHI